MEEKYTSSICHFSFCKEDWECYWFYNNVLCLLQFFFILLKKVIISLTLKSLLQIKNQTHTKKCTFKKIVKYYQNSEIHGSTTLNKNIKVFWSFYFNFENNGSKNVYFSSFLASKFKIWSIYHSIKNFMKLRSYF